MSLLSILVYNQPNKKKISPTWHSIYHFIITFYVVAVVLNIVFYWIKLQIRIPGYKAFKKVSKWSEIFLDDLRFGIVKFGFFISGYFGFTHLLVCSFFTFHSARFILFVNCPFIIFPVLLLILLSIIIFISFCHFRLRTLRTIFLICGSRKCFWSTNSKRLYNQCSSEKP